MSLTSEDKKEIQALMVETVNTVLLPAIENIIDYKLEEKLEKKLEEKLEAKLEQKFDEKLNKTLDERFKDYPTRVEVLAMHEDVMAAIDDLKTENASGSYLFSVQRNAITAHETKIANLDERVTVLENA